MKTIDLQKPSNNGNQYYEFALIATGNKELSSLKPTDSYEIIRFTNYSCTACIDNYIEKNYNIIDRHRPWRTYKTFFNGTQEELDLNNVPKKYQKLIKEVK